MPKHNRRGQGALEAVLVLLVFVAMLLGVFDIAQLTFTHQTLTARARSAARWAVVNPFDATAAENMVLFNQPTVPTGQTTGPFGLTRSMVSVVRPSASIGTAEDRVTVTISGYQIHYFSPYIPGVSNGQRIVVTMPYEAP